MYWTSPTGDVRISSNQTHPQDVMYMLNDSQSGNYSLIIPCVSQQNAGIYFCRYSYFMIRGIFLSVCAKFSPVNVTFSHGESVHMDAHVNDSETLVRAQWFHQKGLHPQMLIVEFTANDFVDKFGVNDIHEPDDLMGRVTVSNFRTSLNISNLTAENSGEYTWRIIEKRKGTFICYEGSVHLLYRDPLGVDSPFYRAYGTLLGCALLGLVAAVVWVNLRGRKEKRTTGPQSREGQQGGDEELYDDVGRAEIS